MMKLLQTLFSRRWSFPAPPSGYEVVTVNGFDGRVLKPVGWHDRVWGTKSTLVIQLAKEDLNKGDGFVTGFTINVVFWVRENSSQEPEERADAFIEDYKRKSSLVSEDQVFIDTVFTGQPFRRHGIVVDETLESMGQRTDCRLGITTYASNALNMMIVMTFGCPRADWSTNWEIYRTICRDIVVIGKRFGR